MRTSPASHGSDAITELTPPAERLLWGLMQTQSAAPIDLGGGNPAFSDKIQREYLSGATAAPKTMSVGGVTVKTAAFLIVLVAAGAWGWASATEPVAVDLGTGYANTTVTIPGGFWLASFGACSSASWSPSILDELRCSV